MKIGVIGAGNMGSAMIKGWLNSGKVKPEDIFVKGGFTNKATKLQEELKFKLVNDYPQFVECDVIVIATKSGVVPEVLEELYIQLEDKEIPVISIAAKVAMDTLQKVTSTTYPLTIAIPNLPVQVNEGIIAAIYSQQLQGEAKKKVAFVLELLGEVVETNEEGVDIITAIAGCAPALIAVIIESFSDAAVKYGLPRALSYELIAQMMVGTGSLILQERIHPAILKDAVTTPKGITIHGVNELERNGIHSAIQASVDALMK